MALLWTGTAVLLFSFSVSVSQLLLNTNAPRRGYYSFKNSGGQKIRIVNYQVCGSLKDCVTDGRQTWDNTRRLPLRGPECIDMPLYPKYEFKIVSSTDDNIREPNTTHITWYDARRKQAFICDGRWLVIQRRLDEDKISFHRTWQEYKVGFGDLDGDLWYGSEYIHTLTSNATYRLRVEVKLVGNKTWDYADYETFEMTSENSGFRLLISGYRGSGNNDPLRYHNNRTFFTWDKTDPKNCAGRVGGGWWYGTCYHSCLNSKWNKGISGWKHWRYRNGPASIERSVMKITKNEI